MQFTPHAVQESLSRYFPCTHDVQVVASAEHVLQLLSQAVQSVPKYPLAHESQTTVLESKWHVEAHLEGQPKELVYKLLVQVDPSR